MVSEPRAVASRYAAAARSRVEALSPAICGLLVGDGVGVAVRAAPCPDADTTALGFTALIFIMVGAVLVLGEPLRWERASPR